MTDCWKLSSEEGKTYAEVFCVEISFIADIFRDALLRMLSKDYYALDVFKKLRPILHFGTPRKTLQLFHNCFCDSFGQTIVCAIVCAIVSQ